MDWEVNEVDVYKDKDLTMVLCPDLPTDAGDSREFWNNFKNQLTAIDRSAEGWLVRWLDISRSLLGPTAQGKLDSTSQGLNRLDRYLAKIIVQKAKGNTLFAMKFNTYVEACYRDNRTPKGRVMLAMVAARFRLDRNRGRTINMLHLYRIELLGYKATDVQSFMFRVKYVLGGLPTDENVDTRLLFDWLYEKVKRLECNLK